MVNVLTKRCIYATCTKTASCNVEGSKTALYCRKHAEDSMVIVRGRRSILATCTRTGFFNAEGSNRAPHGQHHADSNMIRIPRKREPHDICSSCSYDDCTRRPSGATACAYHTRDMTDGDAIKREEQCKVSECHIVPTWSLVTEKPPPCENHGPLDEGFTPAVGHKRRRSVAHRSSYRAVGDPSCFVKAEGCL